MEVGKEIQFAFCVRSLFRSLLELWLPMSLKAKFILNLNLWDLMV